MPGAMKTTIFQKANAAFEHSIAGMPDDTIQLYQSLIRGATKALAQQKESDPIVTAKVILKALESRRPKAHYFAGSDAVVAGHLIPYLPRVIKDRVLMGLVGGDKK
jgi:hypothetical protein